MKTNTIDFTGDPMLVRAMDGAVTVSIPIRIRRVSGRKQIMVPPGVSATAIGEPVPTALQIALARGHRWLRQIESGTVANLAAIAKAENVDRSYISRMVNLTTLAPDIQAAILDETLPDSVSLFDLAVDMPMSWEVQRGRVSIRIVKRPDRSGELQFDFAGASAYGTNDDLDVMAQPGDQLQQFRFADTAELSSGDTQHLGLVDAEQRGGTFLR